MTDRVACLSGPLFKQPGAPSPECQLQATRASAHSPGGRMQCRQSPRSAPVGAMCTAVARTCSVLSHFSPGRSPRLGRNHSTRSIGHAQDAPGRPGPHASPSPRIARRHTFSPWPSSTSLPVSPRATSFSLSALPSAAAVSFSALEEEFSSGERVAQGLFGRYRRVVEGGYMENLKDFARAGIIVYALGWTEEGLRREMSLQLSLASPGQTSPSLLPLPTDPALGSDDISADRDSSSSSSVRASRSTTISKSAGSGSLVANTEENPSHDSFPMEGSSPQSQPRSQPLSSGEQSTTEKRTSSGASLPEPGAPLNPEPLALPAIDPRDAEPRAFAHEDASISLAAARDSVPEVPAPQSTERDAPGSGNGGGVSQSSVPSDRLDGTQGGVGFGESSREPEAQALQGSGALPAAGASKQELEECLLWISLIFVTLRCLPPQVVRRWSDAAPVSADFLLQWRGFCSILTNAYYTHGMAWYSIRRLQMEQMAVMGKAEPSALVADRMRLIFTTLEAVDPRWGGLKDYPTL